MFLCWSRPPSGTSLSRSAGELRITLPGALMRTSRALRSTAAGGFARLGNGLSAWGPTSQENKSLHLKPRTCRRRWSRVTVGGGCNRALSTATLGELFRSA